MVSVRAARCHTNRLGTMADTPTTVTSTGAGGQVRHALPDASIAELVIERAAVADEPGAHGS